MAGLTDYISDTQREPTQEEYYEMEAHSVLSNVINISEMPNYYFDTELLYKATEVLLRKTWEKKNEGNQ